MSAAPVLNVSLNGETVKSLPIEGEVIVGRGDGCGVKLTDRAISRQHVVLRVVSNGVQIERKSEFAPLSVNGAECTRALVKEGDVISIGPYIAKIVASQAMPSTPVPVIPIASPNIEMPAFDQPIAAVEAAPEIAIEPVSDSGASAGIDVGSMSLADFSMQSGVPSPEGSAQVSIPDVSIPKMESFDENGATQVRSLGSLDVKLVFPPGGANVSEFALTKDEVFIGRGKDCDIVLNDKKSSRRNAVIRREGLKFILRDLESANGTYVNDMKITEHELVGDDVIRVGNVAFTFKATSADYAKAEKEELALPMPPIESLNEPMMSEESFVQAAEELVPPPPLSSRVQDGQEVVNPAPEPQNANTIPGIDNEKPQKKQTLVEKFRALPKRRQMIWAGLIIFFVWWFLFDDEPTRQRKVMPKKITIAGQNQATPGFENLTPEQQHFVEAEHSLAFEYYKNKEYDKSLFELDKIFALVTDYKDSREIERYAKEGKRKLEAMEEEKRKKEQEEKIKARVAELMDAIKQDLTKKNYDDARNLITEVLSLDPDNTAILDWKKQIEDWEEEQQRIAQEKAVQVEINKRGWEIYQEGMNEKKAGKYHAAIATFTKVADIGATEEKLNAAAHARIRDCLAAIKALRDPVLAEAKQSEDSGDFPKAFHLYQQATYIDPNFPEGYKGMERIRGVLHERAKAMYTEAVLAESYSDFVTAKKRYQDCINTAPGDDIYHERAQRKIARYFKKNGEDQTQ